MTQQVNLYQPILRRQKKVFSAATIAQILLAASTVMLIAWGVNQWQLSRYNERLLQTQAQERANATRVAELMTQIQGQVESRTLRQQVETLRKEQILKKRLLESIQNRRMNESSGFAARFTGLGRQQVNGLWLTRIAFAQGGSETTLEGRAYKGELVPQLIQQLGNEPAFEGARFREVHVFQPEDERNIAFRLSTRPDEEEPQP